MGFRYIETPRALNPSKIVINMRANEPWAGFEQNYKFSVDQEFYRKYQNTLL